MGAPVPRRRACLVTEDEPDDFDAVPLPSDGDMAAAVTLARAILSIQPWRIRARVTGICPHCGDESCEWRDAMFGVITTLGGHVRNSPALAKALGIVAAGTDLRELDMIDLSRGLSTVIPRPTLSASDTDPPQSGA